MFQIIQDETPLFVSRHPYVSLLSITIPYRLTSSLKETIPIIKGLLFYEVENIIILLILILKIS